MDEKLKYEIWKDVHADKSINVWKLLLIGGIYEVSVYYNSSMMILISVMFITLWFIAFILELLLTVVYSKQSKKNKIKKYKNIIKNLKK